MLGCWAERTINSCCGYMFYAYIAANRRVLWSSLDLNTANKYSGRILS